MCLLDCLMMMMCLWKGWLPLAAVSSDLHLMQCRALFLQAQCTSCGMHITELAGMLGGLLTGPTYLSV
jgi:hypothetical protein